MGPPSCRKANKTISENEINNKYHNFPSTDLNADNKIKLKQYKKVVSNKKKSKFCFYQKVLKNKIFNKT